MHVGSDSAGNSLHKLQNMTWLTHLTHWNSDYQASTKTLFRFFFVLLFRVHSDTSLTTIGIIWDWWQTGRCTRLWRGVKLPWSWFSVIWFTFLCKRKGLLPLWGAQSFDHCSDCRSENTWCTRAWQMITMTANGFPITKVAFCSHVCNGAPVCAYAQ